MKGTEVTGAQLGPFLRMRPEAPLVVNIAGMLIKVSDAYYDNEYGLTVLELDPEQVTVGVELLDKRPTPPDR